MQKSLEILSFWCKLAKDNISELNKKKEAHLTVFDTILEEQINTISSKTNIDPESIKRMISYETDDNPPLIPLKSPEESTLEKPLQKN